MYKIRNKIYLLLTPKQSVKTLSVLLFFIGLTCIPASLFVVLSSGYNLDNKIMGLFIGLWAPTLISIANFFKNN